MPPQQESRLERSTRRFALTLSVGFVLLFLYVACKRLLYPFEVDRVESGMMTSVWRLRHGYPLYGPPSMEWAPFLYAPLFFYLSAAMSKLTGIGYAALRMVSILSTLGSFGVIYLFVWKETRRASAALAAVGIFASMYAIVYGWYDVGRVDSLSVFLFLAALYATRRAHPLVAAFMWLLAFQGKQTFLPMGLAVFLVDWQRPRRMFTGMAAFLAMAIGSAVWLDHVTHHWYRYYVFGTTQEIGISVHQLAMFLPSDLLETLPVAVALIAASILMTKFRWQDRESSFFGIVTLLLVCAVWFVRAHVGANINATIPLFAWVAILTGLAIHKLSTRWETSTPDGTGLFAAGPVMLWVAVSIQLMAHLYRPGQILPAKGLIETRQAFIKTLRDTPGDVWVVNHSYDGLLAGKPMHAEGDSVDAVLGRKGSPTRKEFASLIGSQHFSAVVLDRVPASYAPVGIFTTPPFTAAYGLLAFVPGGQYGVELGQPQYVMLPCSNATRTTAAPGLLAVDEGMVDRANCPH